MPCPQARVLGALIDDDVYLDAQLGRQLERHDRLGAGFDGDL